jgi:hypothetical protein
MTLGGERGLMASLLSPNVVPADESLRGEAG